MSAEEKPDESLAEPAADMVADPQPLEPKPSRFGWALLALATVAALGFAAAWFDVLKLKPEDQVPALQAQVEDLSARLKATDDSLLALTARLKTAESAPDAPANSSAEIEALTARLGAAEAMLETLSTAPAPTDGSSLPAASDTAIAAAVDKAMADWAATQAATAQAEVDAAKAKAAQIEAVETIRAAALSGAPYPEALSALGDLPLDEPLRTKAATGLPTQTQLAEAFPEAARAALDASLRATGADDMTGRLFNFLRIQTGARSLEAREGDDPDAVLSRAEAAVAAGDLPTALTELATLPAEGQAEMAEWSALAKDHLAAQQALAALAAAVGL